MTTKQFFKSLSASHLFLVIGSAVLGIIVLALIYFKVINGIDELKVAFKYIIPILALICLIGSIIVYNKRLKSINPKDSLRSKLEGYWAALILRYALPEMGTLFAFLTSLMTGSLINVTIGFVLILFIVYWYPNPGRAIADLELNTNDALIIENPESVLEDSRN